jgi:hypothetical protein
MNKEIGSTECFPIGELHDNPRPYEEYSVHSCGDINFRKRTTEHMSSLQRYFAKINNFPISYKGIVEKIALCKCPITSKEEHHDAIDILCDNIDTLTEGQRINIKNTKFMREYILQNWSSKVFHKFQMKNGFYFLIKKDFIDKLSIEDKRELGIKY